jgi:hypothetical protein
VTWISVEDRLPETKTSVLVSTITGTVYTGEIVYLGVGAHQWNYCTQAGVMYKNHALCFITHWMPLPEPPDSEDK